MNRFTAALCLPVHLSLSAFDKKTASTFDQRAALTRDVCIIMVTVHFLQQHCVHMGEAKVFLVIQLKSLLHLQLKHAAWAVSRKSYETISQGCFLFWQLQ